jgi:type III secretion protein J
MMTLSRAVFAVMLLAVSACSAQIQHGLDERDANEIVSALDARGFDARKVPEKGKKPTWAIELDEARATEAMRVLTELKLPRPQRLKTQALAQSTGLIETPAAERLRQLEAQEGDIEEALETMDGVTSASVELVVPPAPRPGSPPVPSKASVLLRVQPDAMERLQQQRGELRALVAAATDGLSADDVVLLIDAVMLPPSPPPSSSTASSLRPLVIAMGAALTVVAVVMMFLAWRLRQARSAPPAREPAPTSAPTPTPAPRPVINPAVQRKVA